MTIPLFLGAGILALLVLLKAGSLMQIEPDILNWGMGLTDATVKDAKCLGSIVDD